MRTRSLKRLVGRFIRKVQFQLLQRHRYDRMVIERVAGRSLLVLPGVFNPKLFQSGDFLAQTLESVPVPREATVLDLGTGTGVAAVVLAPRVRQVVSVDINERAAVCARVNTLIHDLRDRIDVRIGDLFEPVHHERFDLIVFNPPYLEGDAANDMERAFRSRDVIGRFASHVQQYLTPQGFAVVILSTDGPLSDWLSAFRDAGLVCETVAEKDLFSEVLTVYRLTPMQAESHQGSATTRDSCGQAERSFE